MAIEQVAVRFVADIQQYAKNVQEAQKYVKTFASTNESAASKIAADIKRMAASYLGLAASVRTVQKIIKEGMDFNKFVETSTAAFGVMMKSTDAAKMKMQELYDWAVKSPLTFKETVAASKQLLAYGFSADKLVDTMQTLGTVAKATGHSLDDIAYVYGTLKTQGRAYTRDLMQFAMRGIPIYDELAKVLGKPKEEIQKLTEAGKVGFAEVQQAFINMTTGSGVYAGFLEEYMKTFEGKMSMLTDVWQKVTGVITSGMMSSLTPALDELTVALQNNMNIFAEWGTFLGNITKGAIVFTRSIMTAIDSINEIKGVLIGAIAAVLLALKGGAIVAALSNPITAIGLAVAAAVAGIISLIQWIKIASANAQQAKTALLAGMSLDELNKIAESEKRRRYRAPTVEEKATVQAETDEAWEKALKAFDKYRDEYMSWLMSISDDPYAKLEYEYTKKVAELKKELSGDQYNTALQYITLQYEYERAQIQKTLEAKKQANMDAILDNAVKRELALREAQRLTKRDKFSEEFQGNMEAKYGASWADIESTITQMGIYAGYADEAQSYWNIIQERIAEIDSYEFKLIEQEEERDKLLSEQARWQEVIDYYKKRGLDIETKMTAELEKQANLKRYQNVIGGSSKIWEDIRVKAGEQFKSGDWLKGLFTASLTKLEGTPIGVGVERYMGRKEGGMNKTALGTAANIGMSTFDGMISALAGPWKMLVDFITQIVKQSKPMTDLLEAITASVSGALMPVINSLAEGLTWLYDKVVVPVGNGIIDMVNALIRGINNTFGKWFNFKINEMDALKTTTEALQELADAAVSTEALTQTIDYLQEKLDTMVESQITSLQDLYEVGAISAQEYEMQSKAIYEQAKEQGSLVSIADLQLTTLGGIYTRLSELLVVQQLLADESLSASDTTALLKAMNIATTANKATISQSLYDTLSSYGVNMEKYQVQAATMPNPPTASTPPTTNTDVTSSTMTPEQIASFVAAINESQARIKAQYGSVFPFLASGTSYVPQNMPANIHKGEMIIPSDFSSAIRRGDLTLGSGSSAGGNINVTVNVEGSVQTENKLAASIANAIYRQRRSGVLTV